MRKLVMGCTVAALVALSPKSEPGREQPKSDASAPSSRTETGLATWYGKESGNLTANGESFDGTGLTAAHRTLPLGSKVRVTNLLNNRSLIVRINDRGPKVVGRLLDLSRVGAERLGFVRSGKAPVRITVLQDPKGHFAPAIPVPVVVCAGAGR